MSPPPLSHFPDLCLLAIFKHIPLSDLIRHIGLVCPNWARVQRNELKRRCSTKHLVIFQDYSQCRSFQEQENPYGSDLIELVRDDDGLPWARVELAQQDEFNTLRVPGKVLTESFTSPLIALLPNITHLTIFQKDISPIDSVVVSLEQIVLLLNQYSTKLVSFKLHFTSNISIQTHHYNHESSVRALFNSINRLNSLQHLSLAFNLPYFQSQSSLRILSRLSTFTVHSFQPSSVLIASLREYATAGDVRVYVCSSQETHLISAFTQLDPQLAARFTRFSFGVSVKDYDYTRQFCTQFNSLTTLKLGLSMPMTMLSRCLSLLSQLVSLSLNFVQIPEDEPQIEIIQVSSVRLLTLKIHTKSHHDTERLHLHQIFPNLQVLHLIHFSNKCNECQYESCFASQLSKKPELSSRISHCMCLARQPFRACANLHTVKLKTEQFCQELLDLPEELLSVDQWHALDSRFLAEYKSRFWHSTLFTSLIFSIIFDKILSFILSLLSTK